MTETWDGRPENPERDGWHWLMQIANGKIRPWHWYAARDGDPGAYGDHVGSELLTAQAVCAWRYIGPCLIPAEVEARVAAARREGIEAALPLLAASDEVLSGLARGECEQFMYAKFAPVVGAFRALLEDGR